LRLELKLAQLKPHYYFELLRLKLNFSSARALIYYFELLRLELNSGLAPASFISYNELLRLRLKLAQLKPHYYFEL
jgi:hypothetical protein